MFKSRPNSPGIDPNLSGVIGLGVRQGVKGVIRIRFQSKFSSTHLN